MKTKKQKIIVTTGPTASGKSDIAIKIAKKIGGEIISADSRQIFKKLTIGSGKIEGKFNKEKNVFISENIPHYLIDILDPMEEFNVSHFKKETLKIVKKILSENKIPIICGGSVFWIDSFVKNINIPKVTPNKHLRSILDKKSAEELFEILKEKDSRRANDIDKKNKVRLIRAIEIAEAIGNVPVIKNEMENKDFNFLELAINIPREILNEKIKKRLDDRFEKGMIKEVENLIKSGVSAEWLEKIGLEYRWISKYLLGKIDLENMKQKLYFDIIHYAKRQMTWLKKNKKIIWKSDYIEIEKEIEKFLI